MRSTDGGFTESIFLLLGVALGGLLQWGASLASAGTGAPVGSLWDVLTAIAAVVTAFIAWRGFERWEHRYMRERQAQVAAEALVGVADLCRHLRKVANRDLPFDYIVGPQPENLYSDLKTAMDSAADLHERFAALRARVEVFIPSAVDALEKLWRLREEFYEQLAYGEAHLSPLENYPDDKAAIRLDTLLSGEGVRIVSAAQDSARKALEPYARVIGGQSRTE